MTDEAKNLKCPTDTHKRLKVACAERGMKLAEFTDSLLRAGLDALRARRIKLEPREEEVEA